MANKYKSKVLNLGTLLVGPHMLVVLIFPVEDALTFVAAVCAQPQVLPTMALPTAVVGEQALAVVALEDHQGATLIAWRGALRLILVPRPLHRRCRAFTLRVARRSDGPGIFVPLEVGVAANRLLFTEQGLEDVAVAVAR